jgi:alpha-beta hydrolase superfamily lysophospholipase
MLKDATSLSLPENQAEIESQADAETGRVTAKDGLELFYRYWPGKSEAPVLVYLHGIEGHSAWFGPTAKKLAGSGFNLYAPDRRGAGMNTMERGHLPSFRIFLQDISDFLQFVNKRHPHSPLFLLGNCWGAKASILIAADDSSQLQGLVLTSPALKTRVDVNLRTKLKIAAAYVRGSKEAFDLPLTPEMFTREPDYIRFIADDPHRMTRATASFLVETLKLRWLAQRAAKSIKLPLLIFQAGHDDIADTNYGDQWFRRAASTDKMLKYYSDSAHTIDFDCSSDDYAKVLAGWVQQRSAGGAA